MQNVGHCRNVDDEPKRISFAVIITITPRLEKEKDIMVGVLKKIQRKKETNKLGENLKAMLCTGLINKCSKRIQVALRDFIFSIKIKVEGGGSS